MTTADVTRGVPWQDYVREWQGRPGVSVVTYENLLADTAGALARAMQQVTGAHADLDKARITAERFAFRTASGRTSFLRKGLSGDWVDHFSPEAAEVFDSFAGEALIEFGYESDRTWRERL